MYKIATLLQGVLVGLSLVSLQACSQETPAPTDTPTTASQASTLSKTSAANRAALMGDSIAFRRDSVLIGENSKTAKSSQKARSGVTDGTGGQTSLLAEPVCYQFQDVYYNLYTGEIISIENVTIVCFGGGSGGGDGGGGTGGGGGGGSTGGGDGTTQCRGCGYVALDPNVILLTPPDHTIQNLPEHLKCFSRSQGATFSIYATQPKPDTRATWSGTITDPNVGHTFISITQGGITRVLGFYPAGGITPYSPSGPSVLADDSDHDYSVRIDIPLNGAQLTNVLNYILAYPGTYNLNSYNCTNFGVGAAGAAGLSLPTTRGTWAPGSGGLNPGDLGQDMRTMSLPAGASRDVQSGQADSNNGGC